MTEEKNNSALAQLTRLTLIRVEGPDAQAFLQGQVTLDAKIIDATPRLCAYCDAKGRVLASLIVFKKHESYLALIASDLAQKITNRLRLYSLRRKVTIEIDSQFTVYGAFDNEACDAEDFELTLPFASILLKKEKVDASLEENRWWEKALQAKFPWVFAATEGQFIPQSINFDAWNAITYGKGCYVGQEVISRIHSLGAPSRKAVLYKGFPEDFAAGLTLYDSQKKALATLIYGVKGFSLIECFVKEQPENLFTENGTELTKID